MTFRWRPRRLTLVGSVLIDVMMSVPQLPQRGSDILANRATLAPGGGFVVLAAARRLGLPARLAGRVGQGPFGTRVMAALAELDVDVLLPRPAGDTGFCVGLVEPDGERTFVTSPGVEATLVAAELNGIDVGPDEATYVSGYDLCYPDSGPGIASWLAGLQDGMLVFDPGPLVDQVPGAVLDVVLARTDLLSLNEREAALLGGDPLERLPPDALAVVRDGPRGCSLRQRGRPDLRLAAPRVHPVDSTGAGDTHTGALLAELARTGDLVSAARAANVAAALSVTVWGSASCPERPQLDSALEALR